ncbi:MAG: site-specific DNA-methyltransferase [Donghicola eburneus]|nr:site-specific DNA-methyltransferase [Donghicola eburneus]MCI5038628.1 site-specific DNA-methyltransferase [Donghicola eburneus]
MSDEIEKLKMHSPDLTQDNIAKIRALFPGCVTEAAGEDGKLRLVVDFDQLRQELSDSIVEGPQERYHLNWPGKREALITANAPIAKTLRPAREESVDFDTTQNLFIEGDNLEALKLLQETYLGKVKMIYIDPPYNTGSDLLYNDAFQTDKSSYLIESGQTGEAGERLVANGQSQGRFHSDWLKMLFPRLRLARQLLEDDGLVFVSIDDNERPNLQKLCEEIFGAENFVGCFVWKRRSGAMDAVTNLSEDHEYILVFSKSETTLNGIKRSFEKYTNPDDDERGPWISDNLSAGKPGGDTYYPIVDPDTGNEFLPPKGRYWPYSRTTMAQKIVEGRIIFPKSAEGTPMLKRFASEAMKPTIPVSSWIERQGVNAGQSTICSPMNSSATKALKEMFDGKLFSFPKPVELIQALVSQATRSNSVVVDFFAGSATTAHSVFQQNANDGGNRKTILVQWPEEIPPESDAGKAGYQNIAELSKERIRRAGKKILEVECHPDWNKDVGFRVLKIDSSNMADVFYTPDQTAQADLLARVDNIKPDRTAEDLLFQVLLDWGVDLTLPIRRETVQGKTVYFVAETALMACFDDGISEDLVKELADHAPLRIVFKDTGFADDQTKINVRQIFKAQSPETELKAI